MKQQVSFLIIATVLLASCQREQDWDGAPDIKASVEAEPKTRTSLSVDESGAGTIYWNPADKIDVFFGTTKASYTSQNAADAITALFKTTDSFSGSGFSSTNIWGLYPSNSTSSCDGSAITTTLPSTQYGVPNTFDNDLFMAVAHSTSTSLQFYNVCGGIKFNLAYDDIKKVTFRGNNNEDLAGTVSISFVDGLPKATIVNGVKEISLTPKTGATFTKGADYYFTLLPCTLSEGFTMEFTTVDGSVAFLNYVESPVTIKRSVFGKKVNLDVYASFGDERQPNNVIYYTSTDGQIVAPYKTDVFGANIVSNEYVGGRGIITFDGDVTTIGDEAFEWCHGLTSIEISNSVTSIGISAFIACSSLTSLVIPYSVTYISYNPFAQCFGLNSIIVETGNTAYDSRNNCNAIIKTDTNELILGCKNTIIPYSVTSIGFRAFDGCRMSLITIPDSVTRIDEWAFIRCLGLTSIEIPASVTSIGREAFSSCLQLASIVEHATMPPALGSDAFDDTNNCPIYVPAGSVDAYKSAWSDYADRIHPMGDRYESVDLGLSVKWATCNLGATEPEGYGDYYAWGETEPYYSSQDPLIWKDGKSAGYIWESYQWCNGSSPILTRYCPSDKTTSWGGSGAPDGKTGFKDYNYADDAARQKLGGKWRTPTEAEWTELSNNCTWTRTTQNGVKGFKVTSKKTGYADKSIFLPAGGFLYYTNLDNVGSFGYYWSSSLCTDRPSCAWYASFLSDNVFKIANGYRCIGSFVRPVTE